MDPYSIIMRPHITEKTMNLIDQENELTFEVRRTSNKPQIKRAFEDLYEEKVAKVILDKTFDSDGIILGCTL